MTVPENEGFYWARRSVAHEWAPVRLEIWNGKPVVWLLAWECEEPADDYEFGPRILSPPNDEPCKHGTEGAACDPMICSVCVAEIIAERERKGQ